MAAVPLDSMDGYEFQEFVANLFQKLGFNKVKVGPLGADEGIDISMEEITDLGSVSYVVECKHNPTSRIGRPVIQKLHSVIVTKGLNKGIIVTSGHFSSQAIQYAENVGIELIDIDRLKEIAKKAGIEIRKQSSISVERCFPVSDKSNLIDNLRNFLREDLVGFDDSFLKVEELGLLLISSYMVDYSINATFSTSVGLIHSIKDTTSIFLDGERGELINPMITQPLFNRRHVTSELDEKSLEGIKIYKKYEFLKSFEDIKERVNMLISQAHTKRVVYYGANNRRYSKIRVPNKRHINILEVKRVYLPVLNIRFSLLKSKYLLIAVESGGLNVLPSNMIQGSESPDINVYPEKCMICQMNTAAFVCSECGTVVCDKHEYECKVCGKVICANHTISKRKFLILYDRYCPSCAKLQGIILQ